MEYSLILFLLVVINFMSMRRVVAIGRKFIHYKLEESRLQPPIVINTWNFTSANKRAWDKLNSGGSALDAVEAGCRQCQIERCDGTVGWGGSPSESGETTLDAMIMDGQTLNVGAVGGLRRIKDAIGVARKVLELTNHSLLVGDMATSFAIELGFKEESLTSKESKMLHQEWLAKSCQPNYWMNVVPDPKQSCGPYHIARENRKSSYNAVPDYLFEVDDYYHTAQNLLEVNSANHDTIGMVAVDSKNRVASGTSTNGLKYKIPGRVGDSPIPGAGSYASQEVGAAAATGDGDIIMRYLMSYQAVENLRQGMSARQSAKDVVSRMTQRMGRPYPEAAVIVLSIDGSYGAACAGFKKFPYVLSDLRGTCITKVVECFN